MKSRRKIGILAQYISTRHDVRQIVVELNKMYDVCVFLKKEDLIYQKLFPNSAVEFREIKKEIQKDIKNKILDLSYFLFGKIPKSRGNYYITEHFKLYNLKFSAVNRFKSTLLLNLSKITPKWISYDKYLCLLKSKEETFIDDIDDFFCFTQIYDDLFFSKILESGKLTKVYVYSWDHPCKMKTFSKNKFL